LRSRRADPLDDLDVSRLHKQYKDYWTTRQQIAYAGAFAGAITSVYICYLIFDELRNGPKQDPKQARRTGTQLDSALPPGDPLNDAGRKVVLHDKDGREVVQTGNSTVPLFPRVIELPDFASSSTQPSHEKDTIPSVTSPTLIIHPSAAGDTEYTLVGLGTRSVSFLGINVYVLGYYIATSGSGGPVAGSASMAGGVLLEVQGREVLFATIASSEGARCEAMILFRLVGPLVGHRM